MAAVSFRAHALFAYNDVRILKCISGGLSYSRASQNLKHEDFIRSPLFLGLSRDTVRHSILLKLLNFSRILLFREYSQAL